jgi:predicted aspartyl protease
MGTFHVACEIRSHADRKKVVRIPKMLVDSGSEYTWVSEQLLKKLRIPPEKKDLTFVMANGQTITRQVGFAIIRVAGVHTTDEVVFAQDGDLSLLGARTLEGLNLRVDSRAKKLVAGGPLPAAPA